MGMLDKKPVVNSVAQANYNNALNIAINPMLVMPKIKNGTVTQADVNSLKTMMPDLYNQLSQSIMTNLVDHKHEGGEIPYSTQIGISTFLGMPMTASMKPGSILANQAALMGKSGQQMQAPKQAPRSYNALTKMPQNYMTSLEANSLRKMK